MNLKLTKNEVNLNMGSIPEHFHSKIEKIIADALYLGFISDWNETQCGDFITTAIYSKCDILVTAEIECVDFDFHGSDIKITLLEQSYPKHAFSFFTWGQ